MAGAQIGVLGPVVVLVRGGSAIAWRSDLQRLLVAVLVAASGRVLSGGELATALWGDALPVDPAAALQSQVSRLRRRLGPVGSRIETVGRGYRLEGGADLVDAARFEDLLTRARAQRTEVEAGLAWLNAGLGLWRGPAYGEVADHELVVAEAARLEELRAEAAEVRAELLVAVGRADQAAQAMEQLARDHPFRERPVALRMRALALEGRHADALRVLREFGDRMGDELGLEPSPVLRAIERDILRHAAPAPQGQPAVGLPGNSFVGRRHDIEACAAALLRSRLVTLTGSPGVGKTRLALHAAVRVGQRYPDGVYLCELARVGDPQAVPAAVASALGVEELAGRSVTDRILAFLRAKRALLVVDNCEHVLASARELLAAVLTHTPDVAVLATSRQRLGVDGERRQPVEPLPTPDDGELAGPAVVLFADRAAAVRPDLLMAGDNLAAVGELCRRLDGLPLAIELAAARTVSRSPVEVLADLDGRLGHLSDERRAEGRHRSIEAVVGWSYDLLEPGERDAFVRLAVFAGGWTDEAAAAVVGADREGVGDRLAALAEHSLVTVRDVDGRTRFSMLEPVRQHGEARLRRTGLLDETRARHAAWMDEWIGRAETGVRGPDEARWRRALEEEFANLRAAHRWCLAHDGDRAVSLAAALYWHAYWSAPSEVFAWSERAVDQHGRAARPRLADALATAALGAWRKGDLAGARERAEAGVRTADGSVLARLAWEALGDTNVIAGDFEEGIRCYSRAIALAEAAGDAYQATIDVLNRALTVGYAGDSGAALAAVADASRALAALDNATVRAWADFVAGEIRLPTAPGDALPFLRRSVETARRTGNRFVAGVAGLSAVSCAARLGSPADVMGEYAELIDQWHRFGAWTQQWITIRTLIEALARLGRDGPAAVLYGALGTRPSAAPVVGGDAARIAEAVEGLQSRLGEERFHRFVARGAGMDDDEAVAYARRCLEPGGPG